MARQRHEIEGKKNEEIGRKGTLEGKAKEIKREAKEAAKANAGTVVARSIRQRIVEAKAKHLTNKTMGKTITIHTEKGGKRISSTQTTGSATIVEKNMTFQ